MFQHLEVIKESCDEDKWMEKILYEVFQSNFAVMAILTSTLLCVGTIYYRWDGIADH